MSTAKAIPAHRTRTAVMLVGPSLTLGVGMVAALVTGYPAWAWAVAALVAWLPTPLSLPALILDEDLEEQHEVFLDGAGLIARLRHYVWLAGASTPLSVDIRAGLVGLLAASTLLGAASIVL